MSQITCLDDLLNSEDYQTTQFGGSSDDWLHNAERMQRLDEAAADGNDGSTHGEHIDDWRDCLEWLDVPDDVRAEIECEIDSCEAWHEENESIDSVVDGGMVPSDDNTEDPLCPDCGIAIDDLGCPVCSEWIDD